MEHSKIFITPEGQKVKVLVDFFSNKESSCYNVCLYIYKTEKKRFVLLEFNKDNYNKNTYSERREYRRKEYLKYVTEIQILEVQRELWENLSPTRETTIKYY
jgi:hypothetical protein